MYQRLGLLKTQLMESKECDDITNTFKKLDISQNSFLIIGHVVQSLENTLGINSTCNNMIWRVDVGMSKCYDNNLEKVIEYISENEDNIKTKIDYIDRYLYSNYERCRAISVLSFRYNEITSSYDTPIIITQNKMSGQLYELKEFIPSFRKSASHLVGLQQLIESLEKIEFKDKQQILDVINSAKGKLVGGKQKMYKYKYMKYKVKYLMMKNSLI